MKNRKKRLESYLRRYERDLRTPFVPYFVSSIIIFTIVLGGMNVLFLHRGEEPNTITDILTDLLVAAVAGALFGISFRAFSKWNVKRLKRKLERMGTD